MKLSYYPSGTYNSEMAPRFLENMSNPDFAPIPAAGIQQQSINMKKLRSCVVSKSEYK
jgi:hypothetical protein